MTDRPSLPLPRVIGRFVVGVVAAAVVGTGIFLIMVQGSLHEGHTDLDFNHVAGVIVTGTEGEVSHADQALGIVGDPAGPSGLYATLAGAIVLVALYALVMRGVRRHHWAIRGLGLGVVTFLVLGLVFGPVADARQDEPVGLFGVDAGGLTVVVLLVSALTFGVVAARCFDLVDSADWWEPREATVDDMLEAVGEVELERSLELPEERPEQGGMRA